MAAMVSGIAAAALEMACSAFDQGGPSAHAWHGGRPIVRHWRGKSILSSFLLSSGGCMGSVPRYRESVLNRRPYHSHRYDVYAPKLQRQVTLFGRNVLDLWTSLEASAQVLTYCERPLIIPDTRPQRAFDFWVQRPDGDELLILLREGDSDTANEDGGVTVRTLDTKLIDGIPIRCLEPKEMAQHRVALANWGTIIRDLAAFQRFVPEPLCRELLSTLGSGKTIGQLQSELTDFDSSTVLLAIYMVLHRGHATCKQLVTVPLGPDHVIERP